MAAFLFNGVPLATLKREVIETHVEQMIALLDLLDGDIDLEADNDDEPSLGWPEGVPARTCTGLDDREQEADDDDTTAPERHGAGFVRCGPDDAEADVCR